MKAVIFARVSTQEQEQDGHSIDAQIAKLREYAERNNLSVIKEFEVVESSTRGERPEFYKMIDFVKTQNEQISLICDKVDRLQRSFTELPILDKLRKEEKLILHFLDIGKLDSNANSQQISFYQMSVVMANAYTNAISDNVKRSILHKLKNGECTQKAPVGYLNVRDERDKSTVIIDKVRAPIIVKLFEMYATGAYSLSELAEFAKKKGLTTNIKNGKGKTYSKSSIANMLRNPFYCGDMYVKKYNRVYPHKYEWLITKALFLECQCIIETRADSTNRKQAVQSSKKEFIFRSLIRCAVTDRTVSSDRKEAKKNKNTYLITWNPDNPKKKMYIPEDKVLEQVSSVFKSLEIPKKMLDEVTKHLQESHQSEAEYHKIKIKDLRKQEDAIKERINRLIDIYLDKQITEETYLRKKESLEKGLNAVCIEKEMHEDANTDFKNTLITGFQLANKASQLFESSKINEKRVLINFVFSNLKLRGASLEYSLRKPFDMMVDLGRKEKWLLGQGSNL